MSAYTQFALWCDTTSRELQNEIAMKQIYNPINNYKVLCLCLTYNQSLYIEETLNGFAMQETVFPFVCLIVDDCSTDGEAGVIKGWLDRECDMVNAQFVELELANVILVSHKQNNNCKFAVYLLKRNLYKEYNLKWSLINPWKEHCDYEAICEGDDYWIHKQKLQMQADFLDSHEDYSMVCTCGNILENGLYREFKTPNLKGDITVPMMIHGDGGNVLTASIMLRTNLFKEFPEFCQNSIVIDYPLQIWCALKGRVRVLNEFTTIYRFMHPGSWSASNIARTVKYQNTVNQYVSIIEILKNFNNLTGNNYRSDFDNVIYKYIVDINYRFRDKKEDIRKHDVLDDRKFSIIFRTNYYLKRGLYKIAGHIRSLLLK